MADYICTKCRNIGKPKKKKRGSTKTEFFCWMLFPFGLPYTFWRMFSKYNICRYCGEKFLISTNSQSGKRLATLMGAEIGEENHTRSNHNPEIREPAPMEVTQKEKPAPLPRRYQDPDEW